MNVDHLYYRQRKASEHEEAEMKAADARLFELLATHQVEEGDDDPCSRWRTRYSSPASIWPDR